MHQKYTWSRNDIIVLHDCVNTLVDILHTWTFVENQIQDSREHAHNHHVGRHSCLNFQKNCNFADRDPSFSVDSFDDHTTPTFPVVPTTCHVKILSLPSLSALRFLSINLSYVLRLQHWPSDRPPDCVPERLRGLFLMLLSQRLSLATSLLPHSCTVGPSSRV